MTAAAVMVCGAASLAVAQSGLDRQNGEQYIPRLGDIMNRVQVQHAKLWFAGQAQNWELAAYELRQLRASLADGIPTDKPLGNQLFPPQGKK